MNRDAAIGIAIMVKTPGHSPVKTRIARTAGHAWAEAFHWLAAAAVRSVVLQAASESGRSGGAALAPYWAVAEPSAFKSGCWSGLPLLLQHSDSPAGDGLGARMSHVHEQLLERHVGGLLLGADAPQISAASLLAAARHLASGGPSQVIGPSSDGGFWLFGSNRTVPAVAWRDTPYSHPQTLDRFVAALDKSSELLMLDSLTDIDEATDIPAAVEAFASSDSLTSEQRTLCRWLEANPLPSPRLGEGPLS